MVKRRTRRTSPNSSLVLFWLYVYISYAGIGWTSENYIFCLTCFLATVPLNPVITERHVCTWLQSETLNSKCTFTFYFLFLNQRWKNKPVSQYRSELVCHPVLSSPFYSTSFPRVQTYVVLSKRCVCTLICSRCFIYSIWNTWKVYLCITLQYESLPAIKTVFRGFTYTQSLISEQATGQENLPLNRNKPWAGPGPSYWGLLGNSILCWTGYDANEQSSFAMLISESKCVIVCWSYNM